MPKTRDNLTDAERAELDRHAEIAHRAEEVLAGIEWAMGGGAMPTLDDVIAWLEATEARGRRRIAELFGGGHDGR